jgi:hypothetical protein
MVSFLSLNLLDLVRIIMRVDRITSVENGPMGNKNLFCPIYVLSVILLLFLKFTLSVEASPRLIDKRSQNSGVSISRTNPKDIWVFFTDKGELSYEEMDSAIAAYKSQMPHRAKERRRRNRSADIDISDLPVFQPYIDGVLQLGARMRLVSRWLNAITVEIAEDTIPQLSKLPYVKSVEPIAIYRRYRHVSYTSGSSRGRPAPEKSIDITEQYGTSAAQIRQIRADELHKAGYHGEGITIALLDTGFDLSHEAFSDIRVLAEYDFINGDDNTTDDPSQDDIGQDDHGTEVLSVIAGRSPGNLIGIAYAADYLLAKTEKVSHEGVTFEQEIEEDWWVAGIEWAEYNGADVVSSSLGYSDWYSYSDMNGTTAKTTIAANMAVERGVIVVVSAGNEGKSRDWPYINAPADGFYVIAVGAVNSEGELADFSSIGPTYDGRIKPDLVAMGENTSVVDPNKIMNYRQADGTSMATPLVAGAVAILIQALNDNGFVFSKDGGYDPVDMVKLLKYTATRSQSPNNQYGWGIVNTYGAFKSGISPGLLEDLRLWDPMGIIYEPQKVIIYPNPVSQISSGRINIRSPETIEFIEIYTISGELVYQMQNTTGAKFSTWDLKNQRGQEISNGIYICVVKNVTGEVKISKIAVID